MNVAPLVIVQARFRSTRLPGKVLLPLADGRPILQWVVEAAREAFGIANVVVATTSDEANKPIIDFCAEAFIPCVAWNGPEDDVLGRFHHVAHARRWHPDSIIVRVTPDDWRKNPDGMRRVAAGERLPVELGGEAFTLAMLDTAEALIGDTERREHITRALFPGSPPPPCPDGVFTVDTREQYDAAFELSKGMVK